jgi:hypothetical protein
MVKLQITLSQAVEGYFLTAQARRLPSPQVTKEAIPPTPGRPPLPNSTAFGPGGGYPAF